MKLKSCSNPNCKQDNPQPIENFHRNKTRKDGKSHYCKTCQSKRAHHYLASPKGKTTRRHYLESLKGRIAHCKARTKYREKYLNKTKARDALNYAVRHSQIPRATELNCTYCGEQAQEYHHYKGYAQQHWFDVIPICIKCHH